MAEHSSPSLFFFAIVRCVLYIYHSALVSESHNTPFSDSVLTQSVALGIFTRASNHGLMDTTTSALKLKPNTPQVILYLALHVSPETTPSHHPVRCKGTAPFAGVPLFFEQHPTYMSLTPEYPIVCRLYATILPSRHPSPWTTITRGLRMKCKPRCERLPYIRVASTKLTCFRIEEVLNRALASYFPSIASRMMTTRAELYDKYKKEVDEYHEDF